MDTRHHTPRPGLAKRVACGVGGGLLLLVGIALLVLPGPGLLLVLAGLLVLANGFPAAQRFVEPAEKRAMQAAEQSVSSPLRMVFSIGTGVVLIAAGVVWWVVPGLPLGGWPTGCSLILSGLILLGLLVISYRRVKAQGKAGFTAAAPTSA
jgi:Putative transmembrane protein (PGPGW)